MVQIPRGLDVPIEGAPEQTIAFAPASPRVALLGADYNGMKPTMAVEVGSQVKRGQVLFTDKKTDGIKFTAPAGGTVAAINRGAKRVFEDGEERNGIETASHKARRQSQENARRSEGQWFAA